MSGAVVLGMHDAVGHVTRLVRFPHLQAHGRVFLVSNRLRGVALLSATCLFTPLSYLLSLHIRVSKGLLYSIIELELKATLELAPRKYNG
jgi:hypothetical protein